MLHGYRKHCVPNIYIYILKLILYNYIVQETCIVLYKKQKSSTSRKISNKQYNINNPLTKVLIGINTYSITRLNTD